MMSVNQMTTHPSMVIGNEMKVGSQFNAVKQYHNTVSGIFVRRLNRFVAEVLIDNKLVQAHIKNTGRLKELLLPVAEVTLEKIDDPNRKTAYDLISVYKPGLDWINIDSLAPNELMKQYYMSQGYDVVKPEYTYGDSRFDFYMERCGEKYLTEIKGCTLAVDLSKGIGAFPDAPTDRGIKHLNELASAARKGYHCRIAFVIQMNGIQTVIPNNLTQPEFGRALMLAANAGVQVFCYRCHVEADRINILEEIDDTAKYIDSYE